MHRPVPLSGSVQNCKRIGNWKINLGQTSCREPLHQYAFWSYSYKIINCFVFNTRKPPCISDMELVSLCCNYIYIYIYMDSERMSTFSLQRNIIHTFARSVLQRHLRCIAASWHFCLTIGVVKMSAFFAAMKYFASCHFGLPIYIYICKTAFVPKWYQFHATDKYTFLFMPWIINKQNLGNYR